MDVDPHEAQGSGTERVAEPGAGAERPGLPPLLPWQRAPLGELLAGRASLPHALLLTGARGHGKSLFALHLGRGLLCEAPRGQDVACGRCPSCRLTDSGTHPDLRVVAPMEEDSAEGERKRAEWITIGQVRALLDGLVSLSAHRQQAKVAIVDPADRLNGEAANALLKTLEEPPPETFLLLVTSRPGRLAATLRSRCRRVPCPIADRQQAAQWLGAMGIGDPQLVLAQAGGAPLLARELADPVLQAARGTLLSALSDPRRLSVVSLGARIDALPRSERRVQLGWWLYWLASWIADLAAASAGGAARFCPDFAPQIRALGAACQPLPTARVYRTIQTQVALVSHPLSPRLVLEQLLLQYRSLFV